MIVPLWRDFFMSRFHSYIISAEKILQSYDGRQPFSAHLKKYFSANKKLGSTDRKLVSENCYAYLRTSYLFAKESLYQKILNALFLCSNKTSPVLAALAPLLNEQCAIPLSDKFKLLQLNASAIFPFGIELSAEIDGGLFALSMLQQPRLFIRVRPGKQATIFAKLNEAGIDYTVVKDDCITMQNSTKLDTVLSINKDAVVQDINSQQVFNWLDEENIIADRKEKITVWDCCAASGGKSILLYDKLSGKVKLTVSDIRENILVNLTKRLQQARVEIYNSFTADLTKKTPDDFMDLFSIIICDAPCTGSGTWSRTPENLAYFKKEKIDHYSSLQKKISGHALQHLEPGGLFFYITCSVFKKENEEVVAYLQKEYSLQLLQMQYLKGYELKADTLFVAVFKNPLLNIEVTGNQ